MNKAINLLSVIPMRKEPAHRSEMVSQLLFGERADRLGEEKDFTRVRSEYDGYEGWIQSNQLEDLPGENAPATQFTAAYTGKVFVGGKLIRVPYGSPWYAPASGPLMEQKQVEYLVAASEIWDSSGLALTEDSLRTVYEIYLNTPYLWGGKSVFGIDCSGFAQQVFKMFGLPLLRDAYLQAGQGEAVEHLSSSRTGDLAFFHNEKGNVIHVGIILKENRIVHASGKVRIDVLDEEGIINTDTGKRSHRLHSMRRYF